MRRPFSVDFDDTQHLTDDIRDDIRTTSGELEWAKSPLIATRAHIQHDVTLAAAQSKAQPAIGRHFVRLAQLGEFLNGRLRRRRVLNRLDEGCKGESPAFVTMTARFIPHYDCAHNHGKAMLPRHVRVVWITGVAGIRGVAGVSWRC